MEEERKMEGVEERLERIASRRCGLRDHRWRLQKLPKGYSQFWDSIRNGTVDSTRKASRVITSRDHAVAYGSCRKELTARKASWRWQYLTASTRIPKNRLEARPDSRSSTQGLACQQDFPDSQIARQLRQIASPAGPLAKRMLEQDPVQSASRTESDLPAREAELTRQRWRSIQNKSRTRATGAKYTSDCLYFMYLMLRSSQELGQHC